MTASTRPTKTLRRARLLGVLALAAVPAGTAAAQMASVAGGSRAGERSAAGTITASGAATTIAAASGADGALENEYRIRLTSAWPALSGPENCNNDAHETVEGTLTRVSDSVYAGRLERTTRLGFCGSHGNVQTRACSLELAGNGPVEVRAEVLDSASNRELHVVWAPVEARTNVRIDGTCSAKFAGALEKMYLTGSRHVDLPNVTTVAGRGPVALEDYGWILEID